MSDGERVEATPIDPPQPLGATGEWLASCREEVARVAAGFQAFEISDEAGYRDAKRQRAALRAEVASIEERRKSMTRAIELAVREFKDGAAEAVAPLSGLDAEYKERLDEWDEACRARRRDELEAAYAEMAPQLVPLVPFERLAGRYADAGKWFLRSTTGPKAMASLEEAVSDVARNERQIGMYDLAPEEAETMRAEYFSTLDLQAAARHAMELREQRERVRALDAERAEAAGAPPAEESRAVASARRAAEAFIERDAQAPALEERQRYVFEFELSADELMSLMRFVRASGIHGRRRRAA